MTQDAGFTLVLVDYNSTDLNVRQALADSGLPHTKYIAASGPFSRAGGVQRGIDSVADPNAIVLTCDLHLEIPPNLLEHVRQHTVRGQAGYNPVVARLDCDAAPAEPHGFWELLGYGLFSMYKADLEAIKGFRGLEHLKTWGAEDWLMLDRVMAEGYECSRGKVPGFYHCKFRVWPAPGAVDNGCAWLDIDYHSKTALWGSTHPVLSGLSLAFDNDPHSGYVLTTANCTKQYVRSPFVSRQDLGWLASCAHSTSGLLDSHRRCGSTAWPALYVPRHSKTCLSPPKTPS